MRLLAAATSKLAFVGTHFAARPGSISTALPFMRSSLESVAPSQDSQYVFSANTRLFSSGGSPEVVLQNIGKEEMEEILEDYEEGGREESGYVVMDVREEHEIQFTGKLSPNTLTLPLQKLMRYNVFALPEDEFEEICGFEKPSMDETMVFSCAAGIRSVHAANFAAESGYSKLVNYMGGANEWFS